VKILIIDNVDDMRQIVRLALERVGGMQVCEASGGMEGLSLARREKPDAILLDVMMPGLDGPAVLAALRGDPATAAIPVVFLTAGVTPGDLLRLQWLGAAGVIAKPFDPSLLAKQLLDLLAVRPFAAGAAGGTPQVADKRAKP
jgi:CheY-like chemotaxis protein